MMPEDWRSSRCGHNFEITGCPYHGCAARELYAALLDVLAAWEDKSGMGTLYNMQRAIPDARRALIKARGETQ